LQPATPINYIAAVTTALNSLLTSTLDELGGQIVFLQRE